MTTSAKSCIGCGRRTQGGYCKECDPHRHYHTPAHRALQREARLHVGERCPDCGRRMERVVVHHEPPLTAGGSSDSKDNRFICPDCNREHVNQAVPGIA